jgi:hypothetical protein
MLIKMSYKQFTTDIDRAEVTRWTVPFAASEVTAIIGFGLEWAAPGRGTPVACNAWPDNSMVVVRSRWRSSIGFVMRERNERLKPREDLPR